MSKSLHRYLSRLVASIEVMSPWRKRLLMLCAGALVTAALPPFSLLLGAFMGIAVFAVAVVTADNAKHAWWLGWWFGFGHFLTGLYWIAVALTVDLAMFWWLVPFTLLGIPAVLAFFIAGVSYATWRLTPNNQSRWILLAAFWLISEVIRSYIFTGFPWNLLGYVWSGTLPVLQFASIVGVWGLSFLTILWCASPVVWLCSSPRSWRPLIGMSAFFIVIALWGLQRLDSETEYVDDVKVRLVQANIDQKEKWQEDNRWEILQSHLKLSKSDESDAITHVIWPESAVPYFIEENSPLMEWLASIIPESGLLISGTIHAKWSAAGFVEKMWNSMHVIDHHGQVVAYYNKSHLVPFGEYVPLRSILPLKKVTHGMVDFTPGDGVTTLSIAGFPAFSPLVCYEVIFPSRVVDRHQRPGVLMNVTNDGWYGDNSGPYQHFEMARMRAVEEGVPLIRAANTGISAVVDGYGRVLKKLPYGHIGVLDSRIPTVLDVTFYQKWGIWTLLVMVVSAFVLAWRVQKNIFCSQN